MALVNADPKKGVVYVGGENGLSVEELEAQTAFELPEREIMGGLVAVTLLNGSIIYVPISVAAALCGINVNVLSQQFQKNGHASCTSVSK